MNFRTIGLGLAIVGATITGSLLSAAPAEALSVGDSVFFSTQAGGSLPNFSQLLDSNSSTNTISFGTVEIDSASASLGDAGDILSFISSLTLNEDIAGQKWSLSPTDPLEFISGFNDEFTPTAGTSRVFKLGSITITKVVSGGNFFFNTDFSGFFEPPTPGVPALGGLSTTGRLRFASQGDLSGSIEVVPTPALLPAALGMGVAALRKKRKQEADADLASEPVEA